MTLSLASIHLYPIKSCGAVDVPSWRLDALGLAYDRRWMLVDSNGAAVTQRDRPALSRARPAIEGDVIRVTAPGATALSLPLVPAGGDRLDVTLWDWNGSGVAASPEGDAWFSNLLGEPVRLLYCPAVEGQPVNPKYVSVPARAGFTDGFPLLLIGQASLDDLNRRLPLPVPMNRFRPNLVVTGGEPFAEDSWRQVRIGQTELSLVKGCDRCTFTTIDQETGQKGAEPLRTLATFRKWDGKVWFGQNVVHRGIGTLRVGDAVVPGAG
jgi:uncharacterized protein YcbX